MSNPYAMHDRLQAEREAESEAFEAWCELSGTDPNAVGAWEQFDRESREAHEAWAEGQAEDRAQDAYYDL